MKKIYLSLIAIAALMLTACGGGNKSNTTAEATTPDTEAEAQQEQVAEETATPEAAAEPSFEDFSALLKEFCGVAPTIATDKMKKIVARQESESEFFMASPVTDDIDKEGVQRDYFNAFAKVADGGKMYGYYMNQARGKDTFKDYDEFVKFIKANGEFNKATYGYDYNGKPMKVYCSVSFGDFGLTVKEDKGE